MVPGICEGDDRGFLEGSDVMINQDGGHHGAKQWNHKARAVDDDNGMVSKPQEESSNKNNS